MNQLTPDIPRSPNISGQMIVGFNPSFELTVIRACGRDHEAFALVYEHYSKPLMKLLMSLVGDRQDALDISQDTFVRVWQKVSPSIAPGFERWFYTVARHCAYDFLRRKRKIMFVSLQDYAPNEPEAYHLAAQISVAGHEDWVCDMQYAEQALAAMSPKYRVCWSLQKIWGLTQQQIADELGLTVKAVSANVSRGSRQLRKIFAAMKDTGHTKSKGGKKRNGRISV